MKRHSGFTLIELMVVVVLAALMLSLAVPFFREFTASQKVKEAAFDFAAAMLLARSEAIKRNSSVTVTPAGAGWAAGWNVAVGGTTLTSKDSGTTITVTTVPDPTPSIAFQGSGRTGGTVRFQFEAANTKAIRCVTVSATGITSTSTASCS